tara:strand:+ start:1680 stop:2009 length:330 start_codon:yes stop_codon:yes gene_type:complete
MPIYKTFEKKTLNKEQLENLLEIRDLQSLAYYKNYVFSRDFTTNEYSTTEHVWSHGDKLYKLADRFFGDKSLFWIIGLFNNKPTDAHYSYGDIVYVPVDYLKFLNDAVK